jgi:hypothetical protein
MTWLKEAASSTPPLECGPRRPGARELIAATRSRTMRAVIVDVHTHVFPPRMIAARAALAAADSGFAALYADPAARMASADDLLASMAGAGVDVAVAAGFAWRSAAHAEEHAGYVLDAAERAGGRLLAFPPLPALGGPGDDPSRAADDEAPAGPPDEAALRARLRTLVAAGARGVGELRLDATALPLTDEAAAGRARALLDAARAEGLAMLTHCTEPVGRDYAGKAGGLTPGALWRLLASELSSGEISGEPRSTDPAAGVPTGSAPPEPREQPRAAPLIAAHWGGGLALYAALPEVRALLAADVLAIDTAAIRYLYEPPIIEAAFALGIGRAVLWGSDFPLRPQADDRGEIERSIADPDARAAVLGGNAARLLGL